MKSRAGKIAAVVVLAGLIGYSLWMWYGQDYRLRFSANDLALEAAVMTARDGRLSLTVRLHNRCKVAISIGDNPDLGAPFAVELRNTDTGAQVPRRNDRVDDARVVCRSLAVSGQYGITVELEKLFGPLPAGNYEIKAIYDTQAPAELGENWAEDLDVGRVESRLETFTVKTPAG